MEWCARQRAGTGIDGQDGIEKNWLSFSVRGHSNRTNRSSSILYRSDSSNCRSSFPGARTRVRASILPSHTKKSPFVLHRASDCCFFIILPWPQRPKNALTSTLTLSGSFFKHLNGGWFRNRFALSCDWCSVLQRAFSQSARKAVLLSLPSFSVLCCGQPSRVFRYIC